MNGSLLVNSLAWQLAGWTMFHFLWVGAAILVLATIIRWALTPASLSIRYAAALCTFAILIVTPFSIAVWLATSSSTHHHVVSLAATDDLNSMALTKPLEAPNTPDAAIELTELTPSQWDTLALANHPQNRAGMITRPRPRPLSIGKRSSMERPM